ncbi:hypothetical protein J6590_079877 [Homalodisca vitripennis]|nr:hypothetical protein J6590_093306 [Homalodisca vitripennis]KAG8315013.1 hypothetical protein J6590_079877 [Homalodisca vitripennis]
MAIVQNLSAAAKDDLVDEPKESQRNRDMESFDGCAGYAWRGLFDDEQARYHHPRKRMLQPRCRSCRRVGCHPNVSILVGHDYSSKLRSALNDRVADPMRSQYERGLY